MPIFAMILRICEFYFHINFQLEQNFGAVAGIVAKPRVSATTLQQLFA
jgi:hypothetical protein